MKVSLSATYMMQTMILEKIVSSVVWLLPLLVMVATAVSADDDKAQRTIHCVTTSECHDALGPTFDCFTGFCVENKNRYQSGCLRELLPGFTKKRVCNSEDAVDAAERGICRPANPDFDYNEVRIMSQNWEAAFFQTWLIQILMSELLDIPSSVETGQFDKHLNFYDPDSSFDFGTNSDWDAFRLATKLKDCRLASRTEANYEPCAMVVGEAWDSNNEILADLYDEGNIVQTQALGALFQEAWYMTRFTIDQDVTLLTYLGMHGDENRQKLADTFLRPTTWQEYCEQVSPDNCTSPTSIAKHGPMEATDNTRYFVEGGVYTGHFRKTDKNDCEANPTTCTGHIVAFPCRWTSFVSIRTYWLNIALESNGAEPDGGYSYSQIIDLWHAANATKSNMIMQWWQPEVLYQKFVDTDAAFTRVSLPDPTLECKEAQQAAMRNAKMDRCDPEFAPQKASPLATCDKPPQAVQKVLAMGLYETSNDPSIPEPLRSPGFEAASRFKISELQLQVIMRYSQELGNPRQALCRWVSENIDYLQAFAPETYPRVVQGRDSSDGPDMISYAAIALGAVAVLLVLITSLLVYCMRNVRVFRVAQHEFLLLVLTGSLLVSVGSILAGLPPSTKYCISAIWLLNIGFCLFLVPVVIKVAAINRMVQRATKKRLKRVTLIPKNLYGAVIVVSLLVSGYLIACTIVDPPQVKAVYELSSDVDEQGNSIVNAYDYCSSESRTWSYVSVAWPALLLAFASALAWELRFSNLSRGLRESQTLATLVFTNAFFLIVRVGLLLFAWSGESATSSYVARSMTFVFSSTMIVGTLVYFYPKFFSPAETAGGGTGASVATGDYTNGSQDYDTPDSDFSNHSASHAASVVPELKKEQRKSLAAMESSLSSGASSRTDRSVISISFRGAIETWSGDLREEGEQSEVDKPGNPLISNLLPSMDPKNPDEEDDDMLLLPRATGDAGAMVSESGEVPEAAPDVKADALRPSEIPQETTAETNVALTQIAASGRLRHVTVPTKLGVSVEATDAGMKVCGVDPSSDFHGHVFEGDVVVGFGGVDVSTLKPDDLLHLLQNYKTLTLLSPAGDDGDLQGTRLG